MTDSVENETAAPILSGQPGQECTHSINPTTDEYKNSFPGQAARPGTFPQELQHSGAFCCWRYEDRDGRKTKVPYDPATGRMARSNDIGSFAPYEKAMQAVKTGEYTGLGIGIFGDVCAIDLDNCVSDSGYYTAEAAEIVALMHSYTEFSPSGNGLHILFRAPGFRYDTEKYYIMNHAVGMEVYVAGATKKYVTVTGNIAESYEYGDRSDELRILLERYMCRDRKTAVNAINAENPVPADDDALIARALNSRDAESFRKLWAGDIAGYESHSEADMALCTRLAFWTGRDTAQIDRLFRRSGLMREKWDRVQSGTTYGAITIQQAVAGCRTTYVPKAERSFPDIVPLVPKCGELPPFPVDALSPVLKDYVQAVAESVQVSPDMAAAIALGVLAVCCQGKFEIEGKPGYREQLSLYIVVIAPPGERKSAVMRAMTQDLYDYERDYNAEHHQEILANKHEREALERRIEARQNALSHKQDDEAERELMNLEYELDSMPVLHAKRFFADDCSAEALTSLMAKNDGVIAVISTEGGIFDIIGGRYSKKANNIDVWLKSHCGDSIHVDRATRESEILPHPVLSAILTIQPSVLDEIMEDPNMNGRGLIARCLYAAPQSLIGRRTYRTPPVSERVRNDYRSLVRRLMSEPKPEQPQVLVLSEKAGELIAEYFAQHEQYLAGDGQPIADWAGKYVGTILRIAGLLHCAESDLEGNVVPAKTVFRAIEIGKYFLAQAEYAYSQMCTDREIRKAIFVIEKLRQNRISEIKRPDLFQMCRGKFFKKTEDIEPTLALLEDHGYLIQEIPERKNTAGRPPAVRIFVNPAA